MIYFSLCRTTDRRYAMYEPHTPGTPPGNLKGHWCFLLLIHFLNWKLLFRKRLERSGRSGHGTYGEKFGRIVQVLILILFFLFQRTSFASKLPPLPPLLLLLLLLLQLVLLPAATTALQSSLWLQRPPQDSFRQHIEPLWGFNIHQLCSTPSQLTRLGPEGFWAKQRWKMPLEETHICQP